MKSYTPFRFFAICLLLVLIGVSNPSQIQAQNVMRIAAVVNDDIISAHDLAQRVRLTMSLGRMQNTEAVRRRVASSILRTMVDERLMMQEIERLEIEITDEQLQDGINTFSRLQRIKPERFNDFLDSIDIDPQIIEDQARTQIAWSQAVRRLGRNRLVVSDKEVDFALQEIEANKGKPEYNYSEIFLPIESPAQERETLQNAQRLIQFIRSGSPFPTLARDFSKSASAANGGNLGWVQTGNITPEIEAALRSLPSGAFSNPIRTPSGIYILNLRDKRIAGAEENEDIFKISQVIFPTGAGMAQDQRNARMTQARTVMSQAQSCENLAEIGQSIQGVQSGVVEGVKPSAISVDIRTPLLAMQKGQITTLTQGNKAIVVLMVCEREKQEAKPETLVRREIRNKIFAEKIGLEQRRQLQLLRRNAIVDIRL